MPDYNPAYEETQGWISIRDQVPTGKSRVWVKYHNGVEEKVRVSVAVSYSTPDIALPWRVEYWAPV